MRILIVSEDIPYPSMGGLAKHALNLARALVRAGHDVDILGGTQHPLSVAGNEGDFGGRFFGELSAHHAGWKELSFGMFMPFKRTWIARRFAAVIMRRARDYDVIHYHGHIPNVAKYIPKDVNFVQTRHDQGGDCVINMRFHDKRICENTDPAACAYCINPHANALQRAGSAYAVIQFRREVAQGFRRHKTIFVSDMLRRNFARAMGPGPWGAMVHNFIDLSAVAQARKTAPRPADDGLLRVFIAGKLTDSKGIEPFLEELAPRLPPYLQVTIAGDGPGATRLRAQFESPQIRFIGWCTPGKTMSMAAEADVIVVPSVWEDPCPSTIFEGLLLGKPTFALDRGGAPELSIYAAPGQLRLHPDMSSLVSDLISTRSYPQYPEQTSGMGGVDRALEKLTPIYESPPGCLTV